MRNLQYIFMLMMPFRINVTNVIVAQHYISMS